MAAVERRRGFLYNGSPAITAAQPLLVEPQMLPLAAPDWAEEFGEDDYGVYCRFRIGEVQL
ncbi:MAG: hypothetical protein ACKPJD_24180, partial [Planctomycetaceae bacterium]